MICRPCLRQATKPGRHRAHRGCRLEVVAGSAAGPCWCPVCHPIPSDFRPPVMALDSLTPEETR